MTQQTDLLVLRYVARISSALALCRELQPGQGGGVERDAGVAQEHKALVGCVVERASEEHFERFHEGKCTPGGLEMAGGAV